MTAKQREIAVSVIILNFNTKRLTADCVDSILTRRPTVPFEIIVVDNASTDGSAAYLAKKFGRKIKLVKAERNLGFGPGNNLGAQTATGYYLLFLNSDTLVQPPMIDILVAFADKHPAYGALGPTVLLKDNKTIQPASFGRLPTLGRLLLRQGAVTKPRFDGRLVCVETEWITGAAMLIPQEIFWAAGAFDSRFFMYFEDQDLCASIVELGYDVGVVPDARLVHLGGKSSLNGQKKQALYDQSQVAFFLKHHGWVQTILMVLLRIPWKLARSLRPAR